MKTKIILIALFVAAFMFPSIGSVETADAETDISHCTANGVISGASHDECVAAAHEAAQNALPAGALETAGSSATFDDSLMGAPGMSGAATTGSDSIVCGGFNNKVMAEINCLRVHLDTTAFRSNRRSSNGIGNYGCGNREDRHQQVHCLRNILDGNGLAPGTQP